MKMSDELKLCPLCGNIAEIMANHEKPVSCSNRDCSLWAALSTVEEWNTRPIEDELREKIDLLKALLETYQEES
jgi:ribosomal protein S27AE